VSGTLANLVNMVLGGMDFGFYAESPFGRAVNLSFPGSGGEAKRFFSN
jgi:hypothetical protein